MADLNQILLFRMTHIDNMPHILKHGITHWKSVNKNPKYVAIGDNSLIGTRNTETRQDGIVLGDYIPFYFGARMPMLYVIQKGFNEVPVTSPEKIVYCISSIQKIIDANLEFLFTDGHATAYLTNIYDTHFIQQIEEMVDFEAVTVQYWNDSNDLDLKRRKSAEFLVKGDIPKESLIGYGVYNKTVKDQLIALGIGADKIGVRPNFYF